MSVCGRDIRQFDPSDYRSWSGYHPHDRDLLPVSLRELFLLGAPGTSDEQIGTALRQVAGDQWWQAFAMPDERSALDMPLDTWNDQPRFRRQRYILSMAKAIINTPRLLLLDDPFPCGDPVLEAQLQALLERLHGTTTVVIATHQPDLIQSADKVLILDQGSQVYFGPVNQESPEGAAPAIQIQSPQT